MQAELSLRRRRLVGPVGATGKVVWWDHERDMGDDRVEPVCDSVADFYARLYERPDDAG